MSEFNLIQRYFAHLGASRAEVVLGVGDDAALVAGPGNTQLAIALDTMVEGVHFPVGTAPFELGFKALAVNLSDLAAMGAQPVWATLGLTLPEKNEQWLADFSAGMGFLASKYQLQLIGGDTTRGPLTITVQVAGSLPSGQALLRSGAKPGDLVFVSGQIGDAHLGLKQVLGALPIQVPHSVQRLHQPEPRVALGLALRGLASSCIDVSDGLLADMAHILAASGVGARIYPSLLQLSAEVKTHFALLGGWQGVLNGGDDYELCFTAPAERQSQILALADTLRLRISCIGEIVSQPGLVCLDEHDQPMAIHGAGYDHFREA
ncbi:MAG: thiamine-phosphate kinase [Gammaproteobacteria bacterium]|nr:thiamine-phosphate kinase [Gammaproteobacteria bacterium]